MNVTFKNGSSISIPVTELKKRIYVQERRPVNRLQPEVMEVHRYQQHRVWMAPHLSVSDGINVGIAYL